MAQELPLSSCPCLQSFLEPHLRHVCVQPHVWLTLTLTHGTHFLTRPWRFPFPTGLAGSLWWAADPGHSHWTPSALLAQVLWDCIPCQWRTPLLHGPLAPLATSLPSLAQQPLCFFTPSSAGHAALAKKRKAISLITIIITNFQVQSYQIRHLQD